MELRTGKLPSACAFLLAVLCLWLVPAPICQAQAADDEPLLIRGDWNFPPYEFIEDGRPTGFNVELMQAVADVMGLEITIELGPWAQVRRELESRRIQALTGMFYSREREMLVDFTSPHIVVSHAIFVREDSGINGLEDLKGKEIIVQEGDIMHDYAKKNLSSSRIAAVEDPLQALHLLASGRHDCALIGKLQGLYLARKAGIQGLKAVGEPMLPREYCFAVRDGDAQLQALLNEGLGIVRTSGRYKQIYHKWFGALDDQKSLKEALKALAWVFVPLLLLLGLAILWSWSLRRTVRIRTRDLSRELAERQKAQDALRTSEARFKTIFSSAAVGIGLVDSRGIFLQVNAALSVLLGRPPEELIGRDSREMVKPSRRQELERAMEELAAGGAGYQRVEVSLQREDGREVWVDLSVTALRNSLGATEALLGMAVDVTERRQAEEALRESEERFRNYFDLGLVGMAITSTEKAFLEVNGHLCRILGYSREELQKKTWADLTHPDDLARDVQLWNQVLDGGQESYTLEKRFIRSDGSIIYTDLAVRGLRRPDGRVSLFISLLQDITGRVKAEQERQRLQAQLLHAQKMEAVGILASGIAHDFNNILQALSGYVELMRLDDSGASDQTGYLNSMDKSIRRAAELVMGLLTFSRRLEPELKAMDLNREVLNAVGILERTLPKMISLETRLGQDLRPIMGDPNQLEQVILNLGGNAGDAMPRGGRLVFETLNLAMNDEQSREILDAGPGDYVLLRVSDTGSGMDEATVRHIFDPFFTTKKVGAGTGLGLASFYGIVKNHGGHINCRSRPEEGTVFEIFLPALDKSARISEEEPARVRIQTGTENILLVDDEPPILDVASHVLSRYGYKTIVANSGEQALEIFDSRAGSIDLVVLDLGMPGMGGRACLMELRRRNPALKVLVASGYSMEGLAKELAGLGASGFVSKPYRLPDLLTHIRRTLDGSIEPEKS